MDVVNADKAVATTAPIAPYFGINRTFITIFKAKPRTEMGASTYNFSAEIS